MFELGWVNVLNARQRAKLKSDNNPHSIKINILMQGMLIYLRVGLVGQNKFEHCSNLENCMKQ